MKSSPIFTLCLGAALAMAACGDDGGAGDGGGMDATGPGGEGAACSTFTDCRSDLDCIMGVCTAPAGAMGDRCIYTERCMDGLYCSVPRTCQPEGSGTLFSTCTDSGDCEKPLVCAMEGGSLRCVMGGTGDIGPPGDPCTTLADCLPGLFCMGGVCTGEGGSGADAGLDGSGGDGGPSDASADVGGPCETVTDCDDMNECTIDQCVGTRCQYTLQDGDEDGYASTLFGSSCRDCNDMNADVNPDHTEFETTRHTDMLPGTPDSFDWNCDGMDELQYPSRVPACDSVAGTCSSGEGWAGAVPGCGMSGTWASCSGPPGCTISTIETRVQGCR